MPFEIIRNDITNMRVDAIVNTANPRPVIGSGVDAAVHAKGGPIPSQRHSPYLLRLIRASC